MSTVRPEVFDLYAVDLNDANNTYLPDDSIPPEERALDCLFRFSVENPLEPAALQMIETEDGSLKLAVTVVWEKYVQIDSLYDVSFDFDGVQWVSARSIAGTLSSLLRDPDKGLSSVTMEQVEVPDWSEKYNLLVTRTAVGEGLGTSNGLIQRFSSALADRHTITKSTLTEYEEDVLMRTALVKIGPQEVRIGILIAIGVLNPFSTSEDLTLVPTDKGAIIFGSKTIVGAI